jgi:putative oxygen-independent coproporphyrinogen III oxidase
LPFGLMRQSAYIHIPFCRRRCFYCDFPISVVGDRARGETSLSMAEYVNWLCAEIIATPKDSRPLDTVFFGGGTPSLLSPQQVETILHCLDQTIGIQAEAEISMEMDPGTFSQAQLQSLLSAGLSRISLGVQAFQNHLLEGCGRSHREADIIDSVKLLNRLGVENFSVDLISGLPEQTAQDWDESLAKAIQLSPQHLSCYDMVLEPTTVFGKRSELGHLTLPTDELTANFYRQASHRLRTAGYDHYEISNYAQPGFQCRHNLTYWRNQDFYGFGMGAASYHGDRRVSRPRTRADYYRWVERLQQNPQELHEDTPRIEPGDRLFETLMVGLRLSSGVDLTAIAQSWGLDLRSGLSPAMAPYVQTGWVEHSEEAGQWTLRLTDPEGFLYSNQILVTLWESLDQLLAPGMN